MSDYRLVIRVKNNRLQSLMRQRSIETQSELSRATNINKNTIGDIANLKIGAFNADGNPSKATQTLCDYFGCLPEDIFPKEVLHVGIPSNVIEHVVSSEEVAKYIQQTEADPAFQLENQIDGQYLQGEISRLTKRQQKVIKARFFENKTYEETGKEFDISGARVRQIESKALAKLQTVLNYDEHDDGENDLNTRFANSLAARDAERV